ncbi:hypothetical protein C8J57DRAFT_1259087 [Mycena rebaudengoi]|nr:hypothetical protein C8J57DRAFT_1259087 [Mycena rebaudengoi]
MVMSRWITWGSHTSLVIPPAAAAPAPPVDMSSAPDGATATTTLAGATNLTHTSPPPKSPILPDDDDEDDQWMDEDDNDEEEARNKRKKKKYTFPTLVDELEDDFPSIPGNTTWRERNPEKPVIAVRDRSRRVTIGPEKRATMKKNKLLKQQKMKDLVKDITDLNAERNLAAVQLGRDHGFKTIYLIGRAYKDRLPLVEIRRQLPLHEELRNISPRLASKLKADLITHRLKKRRGARSTNKAVSNDAQWTVNRIANKMNDLLERCGMYSFAIFSKGHIQDTTNPFLVHAGDSLDFLHEVMNIDPLDFMAKFEQWTCVREKGTTGVHTLESMRIYCTAKIRNTLCFVSGKEKATMNYENYLNVVVLGYEVKLMALQAMPDILIQYILNILKIY